MALADCRLIELPRITDPRGTLSFIEGGNNVPFEFKRAYYLYDVPGGSERGSHAHRNLHQFVVAMSGSFDIVLDDGRTTQRFHLNRAHLGLYICPLIWRFLDNFSSGAVCLVLASEHYDETDYIRDYQCFTDIVKTVHVR